jgi:HTH-type transcriptional regulator / antitoxin HigA
MISAAMRNVTGPFGSLAEFSPDWISKPGDTITDLLEELGWKQTDLASRTGFTPKHINLLLKGDASITEETALKFEKVLGSTARFWLGLESQYREQLARQAEMTQLANEVDWLKELPLAEMAKHGWIQKFANKAYQVAECLKFFAVSSVKDWRSECGNPVAAYRASKKIIRKPGAVAAWLRQGERQASSIDCNEFNAERFKQVLTQARELTREPQPAIFLPQLQTMCAQAGVAVVLTPAPKGCPVSGATKWLSPHRALILLSLRGKSDDKLWFTFFHEAAHLLKHGKKLTFLDSSGKDGLPGAEEREADEFAKDFLLPERAYKTFVDNGLFSELSIKSFAAQQAVSAGIVVGRLQFDQHLPWQNLTHLKNWYVWKHDADTTQ